MPNENMRRTINITAVTPHKDRYNLLLFNISGTDPLSIKKRREKS
jgi:hypothetical protein